MKTLFESTAEALAENLRNALRVAGDGVGSTGESLSKSELARRTGLSRDTVGRLIPEPADDAGSSPRLGNCDIKTLCAIALHLGISPAFLLMTPEDWNQLVGAIAGLADLEANPQVKGELESRLNAAKGVQKIELGLAMARAQGFKPERIPEDLELSALAFHDMQQEIDKMNADRKRSILVNTAVAQPGARFPSQLFTVTALAAQIGVNNKISAQGEK